MNINAGSVKGILSGLLKALRTRGTELTRADRCQQVMPAKKSIAVVQELEV
jgi:hypothetical protein